MASLGGGGFMRITSYSFISLDVLESMSPIMQQFFASSTFLLQNITYTIDSGGFDFRLST